MELWHGEELVGELGDYGYETPWATARLAEAHGRAAPYVAICAFLAWVDALGEGLPPDNAHALYERERAARGLSEAQLDAYYQGWAVVMPDGEVRPIGAPWLDPDGFVTWRW